MEKLKDKFLQIIKESFHKRDAATSCAEITKDTAIKFAQWIGVNHWVWAVNNKKYYRHGDIVTAYTTEELFNLFIETI